jgi:hypothetical protein
VSAEAYLEKAKKLFEFKVVEPVPQGKALAQLKATEVRHLFAKVPVFSPQAANKFNDLGEFLIQK